MQHKVMMMQEEVKTIRGWAKEQKEAQIEQVWRASVQQLCVGASRRSRRCTLVCDLFPAGRKNAVHSCSSFVSADLPYVVGHLVAHQACRHSGKYDLASTANNAVMQMKEHVGVVIAI